MNKCLIVQIGATAICALAGGEALAQARAVEATHFEFAIVSRDSDTSNSTSSGTIGADLVATVPLGRYLGFQLGGDYSRTRIRTRDVLEDETGALAGERPSCTFDNLTGDAGLFFRVPDIGRARVRYGQGDLSADCDGESTFTMTGDDQVATDNLRFDAELYFGNFTLGAALTQTTLEDAPELETTSIMASWYPLDSLKVSLGGSDLYDENTYGIALEHQLEMLGDGFGIRLGFSMTDAEPKNREFELGLSYYFGRKVTLKARDRQYR